MLVEALDVYDLPVAVDVTKAVSHGERSRLALLCEIKDVVVAAPFPRSQLVPAVIPIRDAELHRYRERLRCHESDGRAKVAGDNGGRTGVSRLLSVLDAIVHLLQLPSIRRQSLAS